jgi:hypothetical protein
LKGGSFQEITYVHGRQGLSFQFARQGSDITLSGLTEEVVFSLEGQNSFLSDQLKILFWENFSFKNECIVADEFCFLFYFRDSF